MLQRAEKVRALLERYAIELREVSLNSSLARDFDEAANSIGLLLDVIAAQNFNGQDKADKADRAERDKFALQSKLKEALSREQFYLEIFRTPKVRRAAKGVVGGAWGRSRGDERLPVSGWHAIFGGNINQFRRLLTNTFGKSHAEIDAVSLLSLAKVIAAIEVGAL